MTPRSLLVPSIVLLALGAGCLSPHGGGDGGGEVGSAGDASSSEGEPTTTTPTTTGATTTTTGTTGDDPTSDGTTGEPPPAGPPDMWCPDGPQGDCDDQPGAPLMAGAAVVSILPRCWETWVDTDMDHEYNKGDDQLNDCGCDRLCEGDEGYPGPDVGEGDGILQPLWMAGFGHNRAANGVRGTNAGLENVGEGDGIWARAIALKQGDTTLAIVAIDTVGYFNNDVEVVREKLTEMGLEVDYLIVHATHNHEGPDTMGLWGEELFESGYHPEYRAQLHEQIADAVAGAIKDLREVSAMHVGELDITDFHDNGVGNLVRDSRDPFVVDEFLSAAHLVDKDGLPIATLVNFACHPETLADDNLLVTADFVHALRRTVEVGSDWQDDILNKVGLGAPAIYINGAVGGMMTTLGVEVINPDGEAHQQASFNKADSIGQILGEIALDAIEKGEIIEAPRLRLAAKRFRAPVVNENFKLMFKQGILEREVFNADVPGKEEIETEMALVELGPIQMLTVPGELLPELAIGGYDGSHVNTPLYELIDPMNPNPPKLELAPPGPYIEDRMTGRYRWIVGLGNDELGYIVPEYDFLLADVMPWINEPEGDHYEETNSLGPGMAKLVDGFADLLIAWSKQ